MPNNNNANLCDIRDELNRVKHIQNFLCSGACPDDVYDRLADIVHCGLNQLDNDLTDFAMGKPKH
jgi:hypothetical protein